ncbi:MAG: superinfection immunity protein [Streptosporangiaceae bacterium]
MFALVVLLALLAAYFLPAFIATRRKVPHAASVVVINVFLGWTMIGWVVALAMACRDTRPQPALPPPGAPASGVHAAPSAPQPPPARWPDANPGYRQLPGRTAAETRTARGMALARAEDERILVRALLRRGMTAEGAVAYAQMGPDERRAWREANPHMAGSDGRRAPARVLLDHVRRWPSRAR